MKISVNQLVKASLLALVVATPAVLSMPDAQASTVKHHKQVAQVTTTKKPKGKKKTYTPQSPMMKTTPSSTPSASFTPKSSPTPITSPTKKP